MKKKSSKRSRKAIPANPPLAEARRGPAMVSRPRGFLQALKARYPYLYEVMYRRVDSPHYLDFESDLERIQNEKRKPRG